MAHIKSKMRQVIEQSNDIALKAYLLCWGDEIIGWGFTPTVQYGMFKVYEYFCNLVIARVIINTFLCNRILYIVK